MLPPERSAQTPPLPPTLPARSAATDAAPAPSTTSFDALEQQRDRLGDLLVLDVDDVVEQVVEDRHRQLARVLDGDPVGDRAAAGLARLHADEPHAGPQRTQRDRDSRRQPAAADRQDEGLDVRQLLGELEPDRALARDHGGVLERVHERRAGLLRARERLGQRLVEARAREHGLGAVVARRVDLRHRRVLRHVDRRLDAELARGPRDRLAVVARARRDHAGGALRPSARPASLLTAPRILNDPCAEGSRPSARPGRPVRRPSDSDA